MWLLSAYGSGDNQVRNQLEAINTAGMIVVSTGGAAALLLTARRNAPPRSCSKQQDRDQADVLRTPGLQERYGGSPRGRLPGRRGRRVR